MPNRLASTSSPYLLQHKDNPVDWYPWGQEAHQRAREEDKPILVSIGYSACHWCHVMAHECFESPTIARQMNEHFINIKVDREERPDIDGIYMSAVQALTGQGGWPLNVFLTPDLKPFFGGTYWPPRPSRGMPSFPDVLAAVTDAWTHRRDGVVANATKLLDQLATNSSSLPSTSEAITERDLADAVKHLWQSFDQEYGGFGAAPKFPQASVLTFLLAHAQRTGDEQASTMARRTLDGMAAGGMYDQIGGGFARYSVDPTWTVPHFEKMLYDNAQLLRLYTDAYRLWGTERYRDVAIETADWLIAELESPAGGFMSALDADSDGREGAFYVWQSAELDQLMSPGDADLARLAFGITDHGNFEGESIPVAARSAADIAAATGELIETVSANLQRVRATMLAARSQRTRPGTDTKRIVSWNGLTIDALAVAGSTFRRPEFIAAAERAANAIWTSARSANGSLTRLIEPGPNAVPAMLEDYAFLSRGLISLYQATGNREWLDRALELSTAIDQAFVDPNGPGWFDVGTDQADLIYRPRELQDGATPSGNAVACEAKTILAHIRGEPIPSGVDSLLGALSPAATRYPTAFGRYLALAERFVGQSKLVIIRGGAECNLAVDVAFRFAPGIDLAYVTDSAADWPLLAPGPVTGEPAAFVCTDTVCLPPVTTVADLQRLLSAG